MLQRRLINNHFVEIGPELARDIPQTHIDDTNFLTQSSCNFNFKHISTGFVNSFKKGIGS